MESDDICMDVLSRLPTKTLLGLKCVCKRWRRIISDRSFIQDLLQRPEPLAGFFFQERYQWCDEDISTISYIPATMEGTQVQQTIFSFLPEDVVILGSCNGLVCCRSVFPSPDPSIFVCNPSNKQWIRLLETTPDKESRAWKKSKEICQCNHNLFKNKGIFVGGILHWLTDGDQVLSFNIENELSWLISAPFPTIHLTAIPEMCIGESRGRLHYIMISEDGLQVWALEDYYDSNWSLVHSTTLEVMEEENSQLLYNTRDRVAQRISIDSIPWMDPLAFKDGLLLMRVSTKIILYCIGTRKMEELCNLSKLGRNSIFGPLVIPYSLNLAPLSQT
ncbi:F-box protein At5g49610 isoform X2 [Vitis vinifera]|uniref:F-box protein At5g49610 isoform X2 n=1 Tax=Vitis vinifera TaxID=29760 RepID=UPI002882F6AD|nr:F-box protein At5g49610 isoform X2 [Vitis vinifera]